MIANSLTDITLFPLRHRGNDVIGIAFEYNQKIIQKIKTLPGRKYSATRKCWYIPYTREAWEHFCALNLPYRIKDKSGFPGNLLISGHAQDSLPDKHQSANGEAPLRQSDSVGYREAKPTSDIFRATAGKLTVQFSKRYFYLSVPYDKEIIRQIRKLHRAWWNKDLRQWIAYGSHANLEKIQDFFGCWSDRQLEQIKIIIGAYENPKKVTFYRLPDETDRIAVELSGYGIDHRAIHTVKGREYQKAHRRWLIPNDELLIQRLIEHYSEQQVEVINRLPSAIKKEVSSGWSHQDKQVHFLKKFEPEFRPCITQMSDVMIQQRYSWQSIRAYCGSLMKFAAFLKTSDIGNASLEDIQRYLTWLSKQKVSDSLINGHISALKFYYSRVVNRPDIAIERIKRPRKRISLPVILSVEEVSRMIEHTENLKHKTILYAIYSSGLRLSELLHLKLEDIRWERSQILIRQAKGKKDRVVMLSEVLKKALQTYCREYKPSIYVFESREPGRAYSASSVQKIVRQAAKQAGIDQRVTPHVLRHCFATHLLDSGTNIRLIQELLGHKDIKTTLIYTHVSTEQATAVQSPLDKLHHSTKKRNDDIEKVRL